MSEKDEEYKIEPRESVKWFARLMEKTLRRNDYKKHWHFKSGRYLHNKLKEEIGEFEEAINKTPADKEEIVQELIDIANVAMMIADKIENQGGF